MRLPLALALLPLLLGAIVGLIAADRGATTLPASAAVAALFALVSAGGAFAIGAAPETSVAIACGCCLAGVSLAAVSSRATYHPSLLQWFDSLATADSSGIVLLTGVLREDAAWNGDGAWLVLDVDEVRSLNATGHAAFRRPVSGGVRVSVAGALVSKRLAEWRAGRWVRVPVFLRRPAVYLDPGVRDDRRALARRGIVLLGTAKSAVMVEIARSGSLISEAAGATRAWVRVRLGEAVGRWSARSAAIATAVVIGDRTGLPESDTRRLQDAGTYHVIAISGGNIAILTVFLLGLLAFAGIPGRLAALLAILSLLAYRDVVMDAPSVDRAITGALLYLVARVMDHRSSALNVLAVAGAMAIAAAPVVVLDPGFLLSFGATLGILAAARTWEFSARGVSRTQRLLRELRGVVLTTVAAEAALLPISALLFGRVTLAGLALNLIAIPLMTVLQAASMAALAFSPMPFVANGAGLVAHLAAQGILESARLTDVLPLLARDVVAPALWLTACYYAALAAALLVRAARLKATSLAVAAVTAAIIVASPRWAVQGVAAAESHLRVVVLDVGQGDATAILLPDGRALLVDAGGIAAAGLDAENGTGFDIGQRLVVPALRALGVTRLDVLTITHGDPDHIGGVPAVLRAFRPPIVWDGVPVPPHPALRTVNALADALDIRWRTVQAGDVERIGPVRVRVLHPPLPDWERQRVRNDDSVVLDVRMGEVSIVLPGDIGREGEQAILPLIQPAPVVVLKAPHHGSVTSSSAPLLDALRPSVVIFSAGRDNRFGHPAPQVVARYRERGVPCFSTAESGAIFLDTDGIDATVWGWSHPEARMHFRGTAHVPP